MPIQKVHCCHIAVAQCQKPTTRAKCDTPRAMPTGRRVRRHHEPEAVVIKSDFSVIGSSGEPPILGKVDGPSLRAIRGVAEFFGPVDVSVEYPKAARAAEGCGQITAIRR